MCLSLIKIHHHTGSGATPALEIDRQFVSEVSVFRLCLVCPKCPQKSISKGRTYTWNKRLLQDASTSPFCDHKLMSTGEQIVVEAQTVGHCVFPRHHESYRVFRTGFQQTTFDVWFPFRQSLSTHTHTRSGSPSVGIAPYAIRTH